MRHIITSFIIASFLAISCSPTEEKQTGSITEKQPTDVTKLPDRLMPEVLWKLGRVSDPRVSPDGKQVLYGVTYYDLEKNNGTRDLYVVPVEGGQAKRVTSFSGSEVNGIWRPDGKKIGFLSAEDGSMQIWEMEPDGSNKKKISNIEGGVNGFSYSPDIEHILYTKDVKLDKTPQEIHTDLPEANVRIIDDLMYRHWNAWHDYAYSHIFYTPYEDKVNDGKDIMTGERYDSPMNPWGGMEQITWSPDGKSIAYTCKKLSGVDYTVSTDSEIYLYDLETGKTVNLSDDGFPGYDQDPVFSHDGTKLVWKSMETPGYESDKERIILYDMATGSTQNLSEGFDQNAAHYVWGKDDKMLYFISGRHATYQIYEMKIDDRFIRPVTQGVHNYQTFEMAGDQFIGMKMSMSLPSELFKVNRQTGQEQQLTFTNQDILDHIELGDVEERWIKTSDNKDMLTWIIYPPDFDPSKKYPALLYCQGGPQSAVSQFFSYRWNFQIMAAHDYIIVAPNRRGLPTFGQEWNEQISGDYGGQNMKDYLSAIDHMAKEDFINEESLGAVGASYGGFSVFWLAGHHDGRFNAFISHCGMFNLESQYAGTEEYWFVNYDLGGAYWEVPKPKSYDFSPHLYVSNWDTPIMIITGANDFRIPYTESLQAFNSAQLLGVPGKLLFFPDESHFVLKPQNAVVWQREFFKWLDKWLK